MLSDQSVLVLEGLDEFVYGHAIWIIRRFACCQYLGSQAWDELFATNSPSDRVKLMLSYVILSMSRRLAITLCLRSLRVSSPRWMYCVEVGLSICCSHRTNKRCSSSIRFFPAVSILVFTCTKAVDCGGVPFGRVSVSLPILRLNGGKDGTCEAPYHCKLVLQCRKESTQRLVLPSIIGSS